MSDGVFLLIVVLLLYLVFDNRKIKKRLKEFEAQFSAKNAGNVAADKSSDRTQDADIQPDNENADSIRNDTDKITEQPKSDSDSGFSRPLPGFLKDKISAPLTENAAMHSGSGTDTRSGWHSKPIANETGKEKSGGLEALMGGSVSIWAGIVTLILGVVFLLIYTIESGLLTPKVRVMLGLIFSALMFYLGERFRRQESKQKAVKFQQAHIPSALTTVAVTSAFASIYAAYQLYGFISAPVAFVLLALTGGVSFLLSVIQGPKLAMAGILASYVVPLLVQGDDAQPVVLLAYILIVHITVCLLGYFRHWWWLIISSAAFFTAWILLMMSGNEWTPSVAAISSAATVLALIATQICSNNHLQYLFTASDSAIKVKFSHLSGAAFLSSLLFTAVFLLTAVSFDYTNITIGLYFALFIWLIYAGYQWRCWIANAITIMGLSMAFFLLWPSVDVVIQGVTADYYQGHKSFIISAIITAITFAFVWRCKIKQEMPLLWLSSAGVLMFVALAYIVFYKLHQFKPAILIGIAVVLFAVVYLLFFVKDSRNQNRLLRLNSFCYLIGGSILICSAMPMFLERAWLTVSLALSGLVLSLYYPFIRIKWYRYLIDAVMAIVFMRIFTNPFVFDYSANIEPWLNWTTYTMLTTVGCFWIIAGRLNKVSFDHDVSFARIFSLITVLIWASIQLRIQFYNPADTYFGYSLTESGINAALWLSGTLVYRYFSIGDMHNTLKTAADIAAYVSLSIIGASLFLINNPFFHEEVIFGNKYINWIDFAYLLPLILLSLLYLLIRKQNHTVFKVMLPVMAFIMLFFYVNLKIRLFYHFSSPFNNTLYPVSENELYTYSFVWLIIGIFIMLSGIFAKDAMLRKISLAVITVVILKVFIIDMQALEGMLRSLSFLGLGGFLILTGYCYQKLVLKHD